MKSFLSLALFLFMALGSLISAGELSGPKTSETGSSAEKDSSEPSPSAAISEKPNILLIAVDDLNDWIGCMGGHPQAQTPNIDHLAKRGVLFTNAHCQSPVCNPSRASMMTSLYPETTGIYFLDPPLHRTSIPKKSQVMTMRFHQDGYLVKGAGKIYHNWDKYHFPEGHYFKKLEGVNLGFGPLTRRIAGRYDGCHFLWDWGPYPSNVKDENMYDYKIATWGIKEIKKKHDKPFFLATGFYRPHVPMYAPQKWFDMYPLETVQLPKVIKDDLADVSSYAINLTTLKHVSPPFDWAVEHNEWKPLVRSYLACVSFVDHQIGRVLDALDKSPIGKNTIVVLYGDHGFHLGEKEHFAKRTIWKDGSGVPFIMAGPGIAEGKVCKKPVELIDIYPTLLDLAGLKANPVHEGDSLVPLLKNPDAEWPHMARSSFGPENVAIISEHYRYIRYHDGSEELYDLEKDPHEWKNLAADPKYKETIARHKAFLPKTYHPLLAGQSTGHKTYAAAEAAREDESVSSKNAITHGKER